LYREYRLAIIKEKANPKKIAIAFRGYIMDVKIYTISKK
jgi:hypothetical protein